LIHTLCKTASGQKQTHFFHQTPFFSFALLINGELWTVVLFMQLQHDSELSVVGCVQCAVGVCNLAALWFDYVTHATSLVPVIVFDGQCTIIIVTTASKALCDTRIAASTLPLEKIDEHQMIEWQMCHVKRS
jgi:hypothetical protein